MKGQNFNSSIRCAENLNTNVRPVNSLGDILESIIVLHRDSICRGQELKTPLGAVRRHDDVPAASLYWGPIP